MKVLIERTGIYTRDGELEVGEVELSDSVAKNLISRKLAVKVEAKDTKKK